MASRVKTGYVVLSIYIEKKDNYWEAYNTELGVSTFADTFEKVNEKIKEALDQHIEVLLEEDEFERVLKEKNVPIHFKPEKMVQSVVPLKENMYYNYESRKFPLACSVTV